MRSLANWYDLLTQWISRCYDNIEVTDCIEKWKSFDMPRQLAYKWQFVIQRVSLFLLEYIRGRWKINLALHEIAYYDIFIITAYCGG